MRPPLWYLFTVQAVIYAAATAFLFGLLDVAVIPPMVWLFTHQWQWATFGEWLRYTLGGVLVGILMAGVLTTYEWTLRTSVSVKSKIAVSFFIYAFLTLGVLFLAVKIKSYVDSHYPPEIAAKTATENNPNDAPNPYTSLINSGGNNTIGGIPISSPSPTNQNRAK